MGAHRVRFNPESTRWLGIWLDASLSLVENWRRRIGKTRQAEARLRRIVNQYGVSPAAARNLQAAIIQGTMLYASELTWNRKDNVEREYQLAINRMSRASLGAFQTAPCGIIMAEWLHTSQGPPRPSPRPLRAAPRRQITGGTGARGDSGAGLHAHGAPQESRSHQQGGYRRGTGVERGSPLPGTHHHRRAGAGT